MDKERLIIGMSGASGAIIGINLLKAIRNNSNLESHLVISDGAVKTIESETNYTLNDVYCLADHIYDNNNIGAKIASGSYKTVGMVIVPCSMKTLGGINSGYSDNLLLRAADVVLKERRKLLLLTRETPLSNIHIKNMYEVSQSGAVIMPPVMTFYNKPDSIDDMVYHLCGKVLDFFGVDLEGFKRWNG